MARKVNEIVSAGIAQKMSLQGGDGFHMHPPADENRNGFMTVEDRKTMNGATPSPTPNTLMKRNSSGRAKVAKPVDSDDIARKQEVDNVGDSIVKHINSNTAHPAQNITYSGKVTGAGDVKQAIDSVKTTLDQAMISGDSGPEALAARYSTPQNKTYPSLKDRLDASDVQLADIALNVKNYGAIGDGTLHLLSEKYSSLAAAQSVYPKVTSLLQSIDWAAIQTAIDDGVGKHVKAPKGVYVLTDGLEMGETHLFGDGVDHWVPSFPDQIKQESSGTHFRFVGIGPKIHEVKDTTDMSVAGGWRTNPSSTNSEDGYYKLLNFMSNNASGSTPATTKKFSVAIRILPTTQNWSVKGIRLYPSYNGLEGYNNKSEGLADDWDVGLLVDNSEFGLTDNVQIVGYWRMAALLLSHARTDAGQYESGSEHNKFVRSMFQGFRGVSIRGGDYFRVTSVTSNTIEIPWTSSNPIPNKSNVSNSIWLRFGSTVFEWTGAVQSGDKLTLTGVTPDPILNSVTVGAVLRNNISTGVAGTNFQDCYICGFDHFSRKPTDELGLGLGVSAAIEANNARGVRVTGSTKIATREQIMLFLLECDDWEIEGDIEPVSWINGSGTAGNTGGRIIATPLNVVDAAAPYPAGNTNKLNIMSDYYSPFLDLEPFYTRENSRFTSSGLFDPRELYYKGKSVPASSVGSALRGSKKHGAQMQTEDSTAIVSITANGACQINTKSGQVFELKQNGAGKLIVSASGTLASQSNFAPWTDNIYNLGGASARWGTVFAATGTINTSDKDEKQQISDLPDELLDAWSQVQYKQFKFNDAVNAKGSDARLHIGLLAQDIKDAFEANGLDATKYGILCFDQWDEEPEEVDGEGNVIKPKVSAGSRWGIRADECQFLEMALMRREIQRLKESR